MNNFGKILVELTRPAKTGMVWKELWGLVGSVFFISGFLGSILKMGVNGFLVCEIEHGGRQVRNQDKGRIREEYFVVQALSAVWKKLDEDPESPGNDE